MRDVALFVLTAALAGAAANLAHWGMGQLLKALGKG